MNKIEILAPAGNEECAYAAINAGADAIYLGLTSFSARDSAENFNIDKLTALCSCAAVLGVKVYAALNTLVKDGEVNDFISCAVQAHNAGVSAIIVQDIYLGAAIKKSYPQIQLHLSTQAGTCNVYLAQMAKDFGFSRVIAARETPLSELSKISQIIECEAFVQGALCTCFSGQCYFSSFVGGNSGNRGKCKQPCRKKYSIDRNGYEEPAYRLSLSDLCVGENIFKYINAGVSSFKIEGRLRRPEYVAAAVIYYKNLLNDNSVESDKINLKRAYNRGNYTNGLAFGQDKSFISSKTAGHIGEFLGTVSVQNGKFICKTKTICRSGDCFKILRGGEEFCGASYGEAVSDGFTLKCSQRLKNGDKVFITTDCGLFERLNISAKKIPVNVHVVISAGNPVSVSIDRNNYIIGEPVQPAENRPVTAEDVIRCFNKTDKYPFEVNVSVDIQNSVFIPSSALNAVRRTVYGNYFNSFIKIDKAEFKPIKYTVKKQNNNKTAVIAQNLNGVCADIGILKLRDYSNIDEKLYKNFNGEKFLYVSSFITGNEIDVLEDAIKPFDGIYCEGVWGEYFCRQTGKQLFAGCGFNISNGIQLNSVKAKYIALSKEINAVEASRLAAGNVFYLTAGNIKLMDLIYCPFEKTCKNCDKRDNYALTDEAGRVFPVRRYKTSDCRFEVYNCANLVSQNNFCGMLADCSMLNADEVVASLGDESKLKKLFKSYTRGHSANSVL